MLIKRTSRKVTYANDSTALTCSCIFWYDESGNECILLLSESRSSLF
jgi:hypothetical protein